MIKKAIDLCKFLIEQGFVVQSYQEEDHKKALDAEVEIHPNVVIQIGYGNEIEYGITIEPHNQKRATSGFQHVGYYQDTSHLLDALKDICPQVPHGTWRTIILDTVPQQQEFRLEDLYKKLENHPKAFKNKNYEAKIRQVVQDKTLFQKKSCGRYILLKKTLSASTENMTISNEKSKNIYQEKLLLV